MYVDPGPPARVTPTSQPVSWQPLTPLIVNFFYYKIIHTFKSCGFLLGESSDIPPTCRISRYSVAV